MNPARLTGQGRLVLIQGPPGVGKTTAVRSLARAWRDWCHFECVLDPDQLFDNTGYLMDLLLSNRGRSTSLGADAWRLLLIEDCELLVRADARSAAPANLARLLNLTDGLIGQGQNIIVAITTNEELARVHPAITRPGRCAALVSMNRLSAVEARAWLGERIAADVPDGATLAELFALREGRSLSRRHDPPSGMYM